MVYSWSGVSWNKTIKNIIIPKDISLRSKEIFSANCSRCPIKLNDKIELLKNEAIAWRSWWGANHLKVAVKGQYLSNLKITKGVKLYDLSSISFSRPGTTVNMYISEFHLLSCPTWNSIKKNLPWITYIWRGKVSVDQNVGVCGVSLTDKRNIGEIKAQSIRSAGTFKLKNIGSNNYRDINGSSMKVIVCWYNWENDVVVPYDIGQTALKSNTWSGCVFKSESEGAAWCSWGGEYNEKNGKKDFLHFLLLCTV